MPRPLAGCRVIDLTNVLAGPYCTYQLALLGADVVKVEIPDHGDLARHLGPDAALNDEGLGSSFLAQNADKKSVTLNLKDAADRSTFVDLVRVADVLVENYRAGVLSRMGFDWATLRELNPALVYCAITGFGQHGPMSQAPAYDQVIQGLSGMMSITGTQETAPLRVGFPVCDTLGGMTAALAIVAALAGRQRDGLGAMVDVSMLEASVSAMGWAVSNYLIGGVAPQPMGDQNATAAPSGTFHAADGPVNIAANRQEQFENLCHCVGRPDLVADPRFADRARRKAHRDELNRELNAALAARKAFEWERELNRVGVPAARILTVAQMVELEQLAHRRFFTDLPFPGPPPPPPAEADPAPDPAGAAGAAGDPAREWTGRSLRLSGNGVHLNGEPLGPTAPPPRLGEHNDGLPQLLRAWRA